MESTKKTYRVTIDRSSETYEIQADNQYEAEEKAYKQYTDNKDILTFDSWVADVEDISNESNNA